MINLVKADIFKMFKSSILKVLFFVTMACGIIMSIIAYLIPRGDISESSSGIGFLFSDANILSIIGAIVAGVFICGDFENKTIHSAITGGCSRSKIIISKAISSFCAIVILLLPYILIVAIGIATGKTFSMGNKAAGLLNLLVTGSTTTFTASLVGKTVFAVVTIVVLYVAQLSICVPLSIKIKKPTIIIVIYYAINITGAQLSSLAKESSVVKSVMSLLPFNAEYQCITMNSTTTFFARVWLVAILFIGVMVFIGACLFKKQDIK